MMEKIFVLKQRRIRKTMMAEEWLEELNTSSRGMNHQYILLSPCVKTEFKCAELSPEAVSTYTDASHD